MGFTYLKSKLLLVHNYHSICLNYPSPRQHLIQTAVDRLSLSFRGNFFFPKNLILPYYYGYSKLLVPSSFVCLSRFLNHNSSLFLLNGLRGSYLKQSHELGRLVLKPQWWRWLRKPEHFIITTCFLATVLLVRIEKIPISNRRHLVIGTDKIENFFGEDTWEDCKKENKDKILPPTSPESVRVMKMMNRIVGAMHHGLGLENNFKISYGFDPENEKMLVRKGNSRERGLARTRRNKRGKRSLIKYGTRHLEGVNWEVMVIKSSQQNAFYVSTGKVVVYTRLLEKSCRQDAALATVLGHEVGHGIGRHQSETLIKLFWILAAWLLLLSRDVHVNHKGLLIPVIAWLSYVSRRRELEADYIGLMLMAMAGYNPRVAPKVFKMISCGSETDWDSTHPTGEERSKRLNRPKVMREAVAIYDQVKTGQKAKPWIN